MEEAYWNDRAREIFAGIGLARHLGFELLEVTAETAEMAVTVEARHGNYLGGLHGGVLAALVDTVAFFPGRLLPSGLKLTTEGLEVHFMRPAGPGARITARAEILRLGRRVATVQVQARDQAGSLLAHAVVTLLTL
ncbi:MULTISPECIES: PaaI family thioesterase [Deferrisoma]